MKENIIKIVINKPIAKVFEFSTNPQNTHLWFESIKEEIASEYPPRIGTIYKNRGADATKWNRVVVSNLIPNELFELAGDNYGVRYTYRQVADGTELTYHEWATNGELNGVTQQSVLDKLKKIMEI